MLAGPLLTMMLAEIGCWPRPLSCARFSQRRLLLCLRSHAREIFKPPKGTLGWSAATWGMGGRRFLA